MLEPLSLEHEGTTLQGYVARPAGSGPFPVVMVMHTGVGIEELVRSKAEAIAELGYLALLPDMYGVDVNHGNDQAAGQFYAKMSAEPQLLRSRLAAWYETARALPEADVSRMAAIGFCFGGMCVLDLARSGADLKAVVSFHGILTAQSPAQPGSIKGEVAAYCGSRDPYAPMEHVDQLRAELLVADAKFQVTVFGGVAHAFTDPNAARHARPGIEYDPLAAKVSWAGTVALLEQVLAG